MEWGGQEYRTVLESNYLNSAGHTSWVACPPRSMLIKRGRELGAKVVPMNLTRPWRLDVAFELYRFCRQNGVDLINSHGSRDSTLAALSFLLGIPLVRSRQITNPIRKIGSYKYGCSHTIATAKVIRDELVRKGVAGEKISIVGEGVDLAEFSPNRSSDYLREEFDIAPTDRVVINIGMIREDKGQRHYLEGARRLLDEGRDIKFFLIGEGLRDSSLERELKALVARYGLEQRFIMTGYRDDVAAFIHLSDLVVVASTGTEAQSRIVPQSFATGRTVASTDVGGLTDLVKDGVNGLVIPPGNPDAIADSLKLLLDDEALRERLEKNAYAFALKELSFDVMMKKTMDLYRKLVGGRG
ncbi:MAG: glycosyltransferase family 4 protein [Thermodesulfobacteriota bacterium]